MTKAEIRKLFKEKRKAIDQEDLEIGSLKILRNVFENLTFEKLQVIHTFLPMETKGEINTWYLIERIQKQYPNIEIVVPKTGDNFTLVNYKFTDRTTLEINDIGIPEPVKGKKIKEDQIDLVFLPLLGFDRRGFRVGYGKGFYDRFLAKCRPDVIKCGLSYFDPVEYVEDNNEFDIPLNFCVTQNDFYRFYV